MAVIQIPIGGRPVPIEVPDFAMESTQQDLLNVTQKMASAIGALDGPDGTKESIDKLTGAVQQGNAEQRDLNRDLRGLANGASGLAASAKNLGDVTKAGEFSKRIFDALGLVNVGVQFGLVFGYAEELGEVFNKTARVGVDFGNDLIIVQSKAATLGLTLDQFGKIVGTQGSIMAGLGQNTTQGSQRFMDFAQSLREGTRELGFFGMKSDEMAMILADELEVRRQTIGSERLRQTGEAELTAQLKESFMINEAMARLTGQDVQERRKAQLEARRGAVAQSFLSEQTIETQRRFEQLAGSLSALGPAGQELSQAILTGISTGMDPRVFAPQLIARLGDGAAELIDYATSAVLNEGVNVDDFAARSQELALELKNSSAQTAETMRIQAAFGDSTAETILSIQQRTQSIDNFAQSFEETLKTLEGDLQNNSGLRGLAGTMDEVASSIKAATGDFVSSMTGGDFTKFAENMVGMADTFSTELANPAGKFRETIRQAGTAFGEMGVMPFARLIGLAENADGSLTQSIGDAGFFSSLLLDITGQPGLANVARIPTAVNALREANAAGIDPETEIKIEQIMAQIEANKALLRDDNPDNDSEAANQIQQLRQELQRIFSNN